PRAAKVPGREQRVHVAQLLEPERARKPARGIYGHHRHAPALGRESQRDSGGRRRLAHPSGSGADPDPLARHARGDAHGASSSESPSSAAGASVESNRNGSVRSATPFRSLRSLAIWVRWWRAQAAANSAACWAEDAGARRSVRSSRPEKRCGTTALTTTRARSRPTCSRTWARSSSVSLTGISSAVDTATTAVWRGSSTKLAISPPWRAIGPTRATEANVLGARSIASPCPVAGASSTTKSYGCVPR